MEQAKPANKKALWYVVVGVVLVALIVIFAVVYGNSNQPVAGSKTITVQIVRFETSSRRVERAAVIAPIVQTAGNSRSRAGIRCFASMNSSGSIIS